VLADKSKDELLILLERERQERIFLESEYSKLSAKYDSVCATIKLNTISSKMAEEDDFLRNHYLSTYIQRMKNI